MQLLNEDRPTLAMRGVSKRYGHVTALDDVDFTAAAGEIVALVGDNGAGKSTLVKAIAGAHRIDGGEILIDGRAVAIGSPTEASALGIETVYQDLALCDNLDVTANLYLGREKHRKRSLLLDHEAMEAHAGAIIADLAARLPALDQPVRVPADAGADAHDGPIGSSVTERFSNTAISVTPTSLSSSIACSYSKPSCSGVCASEDRAIGLPASTTISRNARSG